MPTLDFKGKQFIYGPHLTVPISTIEIDADKSLKIHQPERIDRHGDHFLPTPLQHLSHFRCVVSGLCCSYVIQQDKGWWIGGVFIQVCDELPRK